MDTIQLTEKQAIELLEVTHSCIQNKIPDFKYEGRQLYTNYAKYLLEYLRSQQIFGTFNSKYDKLKGELKNV